LSIEKTIPRKKVSVTFPGAVLTSHQARGSFQVQRNFEEKVGKMFAGKINRQGKAFCKGTANTPDLLSPVSLLAGRL
jgi:hypothetical protein